MFSYIYICMYKQPFVPFRVIDQHEDVLMNMCMSVSICFLSYIQTYKQPSVTLRVMDEHGGVLDPSLEPDVR